MGGAGIAEDEGENGFTQGERPWGTWSEGGTTKITKRTKGGGKGRTANRANAMNGDEGSRMGIGGPGCRISAQGLAGRAGADRDE